MSAEKKWRVPNYMDSIKLQKVRKPQPGYTPWELYFDTENEARAHIVTRAETELAKAETTVKKAKDRLKRVRQKFAPIPEMGSKSETA